MSRAHVVYRLRLQRARGDDDVRSLKWVLLRRFGWRALSIEEEHCGLRSPARR
jgi:hypothetical protein